VILYTVCVALGIALAALAARWQGEPVGLSRGQRSALLLWAVGGAILGAYGLQLPADLLGFAAPPPPGLHAPDAAPLGGRTVLGGLLGGWLAVELGKRRLGVRMPTGDAFALPLAVALGCGRLGCAAAGCCAGVRCAPHWWACVDAAGAPRLPVQIGEAAVHFAAAIVLAVAARRGLARGRRLAGYLALYAVVRFLLEFARENPPVLLGLSWHQLLAVALLLLAGGTWWRRR
jgi:phosphatidylglycerol:prolipoprotein diacylglycerol transferase